jgi:GABA(A) receptor-associated protein
MSDFVNHFYGTVSLEDRKQQASTIRQKYPGRLPVIVDRIKTSDPKLDKNKYLVPQDLTLAQFAAVVRKRLTKVKRLSPFEAIFWHIYPSNIQPSSSHLMSSLAVEHVNEDGFLVLRYSKEHAFG